MAAVLDSDYSFPVSSSASLANAGASMTNTNQNFAAIEIREGDWKTYQQYCANNSGNKHLANSYGGALGYKRACALAYLGRRAQFHGGVCSKTHPSILTPQFVADLEASNKAKRYARYPWMEALLNLLTEIERIQDQITNTDNVISLVSGPK